MVGQRGIPGPEVVQRDQDAEALERLHRLLRAQDILDQHAFGDLELEAGQRQPAFAQRLSDLRIEVLSAELRGRDVDGDPQESVPRRGLTASFHQHPVVNLGIEQPQSAAHAA